MATGIKINTAYNEHLATSMDERLYADSLTELISSSRWYSESNVDGYTPYAGMIVSIGNGTAYLLKDVDNPCLMASWEKINSNVSGGTIIYSGGSIEGLATEEDLERLKAELQNDYNTKIGVAQDDYDYLYNKYNSISGITYDLDITVKGVSGHVSNLLLTADEFSTRIADLSAGTISSIHQTSTAITAQVSDLSAGTIASLELLSGSLTSEIFGLSGATSQIKQTADEIRTVVGNIDEYSGKTLMSLIDQKIDSIDLSVNGEMSRAEILAKINADGGSQVKISADAIELDGATVIQKLTAYTGNVGGVNFVDGGITANTGQIGNLYLNYITSAYTTTIHHNYWSAITSTTKEVTKEGTASEPVYTDFSNGENARILGLTSSKALSDIIKTDVENLTADDVCTDLYGVDYTICALQPESLTGVGNCYNISMVISKYNVSIRLSSPHGVTIQTITKSGSDDFNIYTIVNTLYTTFINSYLKAGEKFTMTFYGPNTTASALGTDVNLPKYFGIVVDCVSTVEIITTENITISGITSGFTSDDPEINVNQVTYPIYHENFRVSNEGQLYAKNTGGADGSGFTMEFSNDSFYAGTTSGFENSGTGKYISVNKFNTLTDTGKEQAVIIKGGLDVDVLSVNSCEIGGEGTVARIQIVEDSVYESMKDAGKLDSNTMYITY